VQSGLEKLLGPSTSRMKHSPTGIQIYLWPCMTLTFGLIMIFKVDRFMTARLPCESRAPNGIKICSFIQNIVFSSQVRQHMTGWEYTDFGLCLPVYVAWPWHKNVRERCKL